MFEYLIKKIQDAGFETEPFTHLEINNFFSPEDFQKILSAPEIALPAASSDQELCEMLWSEPEVSTS